MSWATRNGLRIGLRGCFFVPIDVRGGPRRFRGVPGGRFRPKTTGKPARKSPARLPSGTQLKANSPHLPLASRRLLSRRAPGEGGGGLWCSRQCQTSPPLQRGTGAKYVLAKKSIRPGGPHTSGYPKAAWLEIFGPVFPVVSAETDPRDPPRSPGPAPHIDFH